MLYDKIEPLLAGVSKPARYTGGEVNMVKKELDGIDVRFAFCFPDTYEVGMSHLGMKILYHVLNKRENFYCERVFAPWTDMENAMRENNVPLYSLETFSPVKDFDLVGFTLQYEMSYTNILNMLDLAGIPLTWKERDAVDAPFVVCGGPCAFNAEPLTDFVDLVMVGDGEEQIVELCEEYEKWKKQGGTREEFLVKMANLEGNYVPRFYEDTYDENGNFAGLVRTRDDVPERIRKRCISDLDAADYPDKIIVPFTEIVHDRVMLEVARGCTRGCRFCQAGMLYRPQRERSMPRLLELARQLLGSTGYEEMSLSSLSTGDYSCLPELAKALVEEHGCNKVAISLPSLRIDSVLGDTLEQTQQIRKTGLTFAPEAGTQRLRNVINKGVTEEQLRASVHDAFSKGWSGVKLYTMIGLPTETDEDLEGIPGLAKAVLDEYFAVPKEIRQKGLRVGVSASSFVPKPFTPFQWEPQNTIEELERKQKFLRDRLKLRSVTFNWHEPHLSFLEAAFARGDRRLNKVLLAAYKRGCKFDGWTEEFKFDEWMNAFADAGLTCEMFAHKRYDLNDPLPWDHIDCGVTKEFLKREWLKALKEETSPDCRVKCHGCGMKQFVKGVCKSCE